MSTCKKTVGLWRHLHSVHTPRPFEYQRDDIIYDEHTEQRNHYLDDYRFDRLDELGISNFNEDSGRKWD